MIRRFHAAAIVLAVALPACSVPQPQRATGHPVALGTEAADWDAVFARTTGWTGGDAIYSIDLGSGRTLWLFGDTWIGSITNGRHAPGSHLVNNTIAIQTTTRPDRKSPQQATPPGRITFHWGPNNPKGKPTAWIVPDPARGKARGITPAGGWYWPSDGAVVPRPSDGRPRLVLFLHQIGRRTGDHGIWGFKGVGGALAVIDNPHDPADRWQVEQSDNPHAVDTDTAAASPSLHEISWGAAVYFDAAGGSGQAGCLYIYGIKETHPLNKQLLLARAPAATVKRFDTWRFHTTEGGWSGRLSDAAPIADHLVNELSVERVMIGARPMFVMVHSEPVFGHQILLRAADRPEGPWSKPIPVYEVPGVKRNPAYFTYAAKGHAHLSAPGELLISYVINSHDFKAMVADADIYRPRFIRVRLDRLVFGDRP